MLVAGHNAGAAAQAAAQIAGVAKVIHADFYDAFVKMEAVSATALIESGGWSAARGRGLVRIEGKEYVMGDDDVVVFHHTRK